jgi:hypothetical protein
VLIDKAETNSGVGRLFSQAPDIDGIVKIKSKVMLFLVNL